MNTVEIYTKDWCAYSGTATTLLEDLSIPFTEIDVTSDPVREQEMRERAHQSTVPQIFSTVNMSAAAMTSGRSSTAASWSACWKPPIQSQKWL